MPCLGHKILDSEPGAYEEKAGGESEGGEELTQLVTGLQHKPEDVRLSPQHPDKKPGTI